MQYRKNGFLLKQVKKNVDLWCYDEQYRDDEMVPEGAHDMNDGPWPSNGIRIAPRKRLIISINYCVFGKQMCVETPSATKSSKTQDDTPNN